MISRRHRLALAVLAACALLASGCAHSINEGNSPSGVPLRQPDVLMTCTHLPFQPFQFMEGNEVVGFDVELVDLIARDLGVEQEINDTPFEGIQSGESLNSDQCDIAAAAMTITETRQLNMDFSEPYFNAEQALLVKKSQPHADLASLRGKTLGVQLGTTGEEYAQRNQDRDGYQTVQFEDLALLESAVRTGQVDAAINDNGVLLNFAKNNPDTMISTQFTTGDKYGLAIRKGNTKLVDKVNESLRKAVETGEYAALYRKWFGTEPPPEN